MKYLLKYTYFIGLSITLLVKSDLQVRLEKVIDRINIIFYVVILIKIISLG